MNSAQRDAVIVLAPDAAERTLRPNPGPDVPDPADQRFEAYRNRTRRLHALVRQQLAERRTRYTLSGTEGP